ncbi:hypothetical protein ACX0GZ_02100 [Sphingomonas aestuarii]
MELELEKADSVFDILYADERRIASLLSQMGSDGVLRELTRLTEVTSGASRGLDAKLLKLDSNDGEKTSLSRTFDPRWLIPLLFLDEAADRIVRNADDAVVGGLILVKGRLVVTDVKLLQELWKAPAMKKVMLNSIADGESDATQSNRQERRSSQRAHKKRDTTQQEALLEFIPHMPHSPQINIVSGDEAFWATIDPSNLVGSVQDLILKHGARVAGDWSMVGIYDARPFSDEDHGLLDTNDYISIGALQDSIWKVALDLATPIRQAMGRPFLSHGVTPLIIFREVA